MARGQVVADGPPTEIKAGRLPHAAGNAPWRAGRRVAGLPGVSSAERRGEAIILSCSDSDQTIRALLERHPARATSRSRVARSRTRSSRSPPTTLSRWRGERHPLHPLRAPARDPQPPLLLLLDRLPARVLPRDRGPVPQQPELRQQRHLVPALLHGRADLTRHDDRDDLERRADRRRTPGRLDATAADHAADDARLLPRQGPHRLHDGLPDDPRPLLAGHCWA